MHLQPEAAGSLAAQARDFKSQAGPGRHNTNVIELFEVVAAGALLGPTETALGKGTCYV